VGARLRSLLFPDPPREFAGRRTLKIVLRGVHVVCAGLCLGAYAFDVAAGERGMALAAALGSGLAILALDVHETAAFFLQVRGVVVVFKIALLALLPWFGDARALVIGALMLLSVVSSHAPGKIRHRQIAGAGRIEGARTHG